MISFNQWIVNESNKSNGKFRCTCPCKECKEDKNCNKCSCDDCTCKNCNCANK